MLCECFGNFDGGVLHRLCSKIAVIEQLVPFVLLNRRNTSKNLRLCPRAAHCIMEFSHPAQILTRMTVLTADAHLSRLIIMHELYHLLGFHHPGSLEGVAMSDTLHAGQFNQHGERVPTRAEAIDLARLACIYVR